MKTFIKIGDPVLGKKISDEKDLLSVCVVCAIMAPHTEALGLSDIELQLKH